MRSSFQKLFKKRKGPEPTPTQGIVQEPPQDLGSQQYRQVESSAISSSSPQELMQIIYQYDTEVKRLNSALEEAKASCTDLEKTRDEAQLYREHTESLQKHAQALNEDLVNTKTLLDNKNSEVTLLREQLATKESLLAQLRDVGKDSGESVELKAAQQSVKLLEKELAQKASFATSLQNDKSHLVNKVSSLERELQTAELTLRKERIETEAARGELNRVNYLRQSLENEIKALRDSLTRTDEKLRHKEDKLEALQENMLQKQSELAAQRQESETKRMEMTRASNLLEDSLRKDLERLETQLIKEREERRKDAELAQNKLDRLEAGIVEAEAKATSMALRGGHANAEFELMKQSCEAAVTRSSKLEVENQKLIDYNAKLQKKREIAKAEVMRLSQKLETRSNPETKQWVKLNSAIVAPQESSAFVLIKMELEVLYKQLMTLMMNARTTSGPRLDYLICAEDFSQFERRLNNLFMQVQESIDLPETTTVLLTPPEVSKSWGKKLSGAVSSIVSGRGPVKLFSCMSSDPSQTQTPKTVQGRALKSNTGDKRPTPGLSRLS